MNIIEELQKELKSEYQITKKFLEKYPESKNDWKPHEKSMSMKTLVVHVIEIFAWPEIIMNTDFLDFAETPYTQPEIRTLTGLQQKLEDDYRKGAQTLKNLTPEKLDGKWDIRKGEIVFQEWSKYGAIRHSFQQITHHRAQLGVYYRLNDIFVPGSYGPSADER
ncbi:MAG: damage-inducible protein DinB [Pricia sp.]|nr:damage-inducible protein DinB [Pricia sp.]